MSQLSSKVEAQETHPSFECLRHADLDGSAATVGEYVHTASGLKHVHLGLPSKAGGGLNAAVLALASPVPDDSGITHVLEHMVLSGSRRYPVRGAFFRMMSRSLSTSMNALTTDDCTSFHFATPDSEDFANLLAVYLDALFFPRLDELDFAREAHRLTFTPGDTQTELRREGVVLNEMRGAWASPLVHLELAVARALFDTGCYTRAGAGDPRVIPVLDIDRVRSYHTQHYLPGVALLLTAGNTPAEAHQAVVDGAGLEELPRVPEDAGAGPEPVRIGTGSNAPPGEGGRKPAGAVRDVRATWPAPARADDVHVALGWRLGSAADPQARLEARLIDALLHADESAPVARALASAIGGAALPGPRLSEWRASIVWTCGRTGCEAGRAKDAAAVALEAIEARASRAFSADELGAALDAVERSLLGANHERYPPPLDRLMSMLPALRHGGDALDHADLSGAMAALRTRTDAAYTAALVGRLLGPDARRAVVRLEADPDQVAERRSAEADELRDLANKLDSAGRGAIAAQDAALADRSTTSVGERRLPTLSPHQAVATLGASTPCKPRVIQAADGPFVWHERPGEALCHVALGVRLPMLTEPLLEVLPLLVGALGSEGFVTETEAARRRRVRLGLTVSARLTAKVRREPEAGSDKECGRDDVTVSLALAGSSLPIQLGDLKDVLRSVLRDVRFDSPQRLSQLIASERARLALGLRREGHRFAQWLAGAGLSPVAALDHRWRGMAALESMERLHRDVQAHPQRLSDCVAALRELAVLVGSLNPDTVVLASRDALGTGLMEQEDNEPVAPGNRPESTWAVAAEALESEPKRIVIDSQVAYCGYAVACHAPDAADRAALHAFAAGLTQARLLPLVRELGGAYGAGAKFWPDGKLLTLFSFRDPAPAATLSVFEQGLAWPGDDERGGNAVDLAALGALREQARPVSAVEQAFRALEDKLHGTSISDELAAEHARMATLSLGDLQGSAARLASAPSASAVLAPD